MASAEAAELLAGPRITWVLLQIPALTTGAYFAWAGSALLGLACSTAQYGVSDPSGGKNLGTLDEDSRYPWYPIKGWDRLHMSATSHACPEQIMIMHQREDKDLALCSSCNIWRFTMPMYAKSSTSRLRAERLPLGSLNLVSGPWRFQVSNSLRSVYLLLVRTLIFRCAALIPDGLPIVFENLHMY